jgi:hypothetical protein
MEDNNIKVIKDQINKKMSPYPYTISKNVINDVVTDMDHHPYTRWYRGVYYSSEPMVMEREAGWRPIKNNCYIKQPIQKKKVICPVTEIIDHDIDNIKDLSECKCITVYR